MGWSEEEFIDVSRATLEYIGFDSNVIQDTLLNFNKQSQEEVAQKCMKDGAESFARFLNKDTIAMTGLQYMLSRHSDVLED